MKWKGEWTLEKEEIKRKMKERSSWRRLKKDEAKSQDRRKEDKRREVKYLG